MNLHVVALPHTQVTREWSACAYTQKVRRFVDEMSERGHLVTLYGPEVAQTKAAEHVTCITTAQQAGFGFEGHASYNVMRWDHSDPLWLGYNRRVTEAMARRVKPRDLVCIVSGNAGQPLVDAMVATTLVCEFGVGYTGTCVGTHRVFESHTWRSYVHGASDDHLGRAFDEVIPNGYDVADYPFGPGGDYVAFCGRLDAAKGLNVAQQACERAGIELRCAGVGEWPGGYGEHLGLLGQSEVTELMANARAVMVPTDYLGPFEGVHVEAQLCGTPVITTDWGIFTETVTSGVNGFRCKVLRDYLDALDVAVALDRAAIRRTAQDRWSMQTVGDLYDAYFARLDTLWDGGWYA